MYLELKDISKRFDNKEVVKNLSLGIKEGEILCLLGASGCGKTTTLKMIGGFLRPDGGEILLEGEDIGSLSPEVRPVSTVFQSYALFPHMNVLKNVMYGLKYQGYSKKQARQEAQRYLELVDLGDYQEARTAEISGGQRQRVALARALVTKPKVLLLDEPLSNLDAALRVKMREEIRDIQRKFKITTIFVTHDQEEAMVVADRIGIMHDGKLTQVGTPEEVYLRPRDAYTKGFLGRVNSFLTPDNERISCRPEEMQFCEAGPFHGTLVKKEFLGFYRLFYLQVGEDEIVLRGDGNKDYKLGGEVFFCLKK
ncbi:iron(III) transport system ATP-binding protein [Lachnospiraceae bacterium PF1-22]|uniref:ABC transporter ATP-binding protein n=1 Tax=Ohessyouella blattaphilus TaxID=2949333 RepID=UPI003E2403A2